MPFLKVIKSTGEVSTCPLEGKEILIGRSHECQILIEEQLVSRKHAKIFCDGDKYFVEDLNSVNGVYINGAKVKKQAIAPGDKILVGDSQIVYIDSEKDDQPLANLSVSKPIDEIANAYNLSVRRSQVASIRDTGKPVGSGTQGAKPTNFISILYQTSLWLAKEGHADKLLREALSIMVEVLQVERAAVYFLKPFQGIAGLAFVRGQGYLSLNEAPVSKSVIGEVTSQRKVVVLTNLQEDEKFSQMRSIKAQKITSVICAPIWDDVDIYGTVYADTRDRPRVFSQDDIALVTGFGNILGSLVKRQILAERLQSEEVTRKMLTKYHSPEIVELLITEGQERLKPRQCDVTVLFADIADSTTLFSRMPATEISNMLKTFYTSAGDVIRHHSGHINKFIGDCVFGVFNAPITIENHEEHAVRAAFDIIDKTIPEIEKNHGRKIGIHIGINTGSVIAGNVGSDTVQEYAILGHSVNVASKISKDAVDRVVVAEPSTKNLQGKFKLEQIGLYQDDAGTQVKVFEAKV